METDAYAADLSYEWFCDKGRKRKSEDQCLYQRWDSWKDGKPLDVGMDIFHRGLCLPSDNKMTVERQNRIIEVIKECFA